jgi:hypothetical protein
VSPIGFSDERPQRARGIANTPELKKRALVSSNTNEVQLQAICKTLRASLAPNCFVNPSAWPVPTVNETSSAIRHFNLPPFLSLLSFDLT